MKKFAAIVLCLIMVLSLVACGGKKENDKTVYKITYANTTADANPQAINAKPKTMPTSLLLKPETSGLSKHVIIKIIPKAIFAIIAPKLCRIPVLASLSSAIAFFCAFLYIL